MGRQKEIIHKCPICGEGILEVGKVDILFVYCNVCHIEFSSGIIDDKRQDGKFRSEKAYLKDFIDMHLQMHKDRHFEENELYRIINSSKTYSEIGKNLLEALNIQDFREE